MAGRKRHVGSLGSREIHQNLENSQGSVIQGLLSCKVSPEVWLSTLGQTPDPSLAWKKVTFSKLKMMMIIKYYIQVKTLLLVKV